jgi:N-acetylneuraminic acid mutarotase
MVTPHGFHVATLLRDGRVLVAGGLINDRLDGRVSASAELYDANSASWTVARRMIEARWGHTATLLPDGRVLVAGSNVHGSDPLASAELYQPSSASWTATGSMDDGRGGHTATLLADGTVLVGGGYSLTAPDGLASAELYAPGSGSWTPTASMGTSRQGHTATLLADGRVLVVGGGGEVTLAEGPAYGATAELYDPSTGRWTDTGSMTMARYDHTATRLPDGSVLVVGGSVGDDVTARSAELYDPRSGNWTVTSSMANARSGHSTTLLPNGTVLVTGGVGLGSTPTPLASSELYEPSSGKWTVTASMAEARPNHTATLLPDGRVLVVGDYDYDSRASAEVYDPGYGT